MKRILKMLEAFTLALLFMLGMTIAHLLALYVAAGVALHGDWDRVHSAIERAYNEFVD